VYGKEAILPLHGELNSLILIIDGEQKEEQLPMQKLYNEIMQLIRRPKGASNTGNE
jgi:hypothetical protein